MAPLMPLQGALAASITPLRALGAEPDDEAFGSLCDFYVAAGLDGVLALGTAGEGILLSVEERRRVADRFLQAADNRLQVAVHCGAQTTRDTVALASHARDAGTDAVAVIAPPSFPLDAEELFAHLATAAEACAPLPFYVYEFVGRSGYAIPIEVIERLRREATNLAGMKVSDTPWSAVEPYVLEGVDLFVGSEPLVLRGFEAGATGAVSGLATAFPEIVAELVNERSDDAGAKVTALRQRLGPLPFITALKVILGARGVPVSPGVRRPLRALSDAERALALDAARAVGVEV
jgi:dihydrodipicolinate synthase/N-acetylneuraminate lyase